MGGSKKRAGLFVLDPNGNTLCVVRSAPYKGISSTNTDNDGDNKLKIRLVDCCGVDETPLTDPMLQTWSLRPFLEMLQIPRGTRERGDSCLADTALREFCEETLCANKTITLSDDVPTELKWTDDGKCWKYDIFIARTRELLYFAFDPSSMRRVNMHVSKPDGESTLNDRDYTFYTCAISRTSDGVIHHLVVINTKDYIDFMVNYQLKFYETHNYNTLFEKLLSVSPIEGRLTLPSPGDVPTGGKKKKIVKNVVSPEMYKRVKSNRDLYVIKFDLTVYSSSDKNSQMFKIWSGWWWNWLWRSAVGKSICTKAIC